MVDGARRKALQPNAIAGATRQWRKSASLFIPGMPRQNVPTLRSNSTLDFENV
jgi:hypothetical protein